MEELTLPLLRSIFNENVAVAAVSGGKFQKDCR
jgi:hypothetical protein